jgi:hypothetical protein
VDAAPRADSRDLRRMSTGQLSSLNAYVPFQGTGSLWNTDISAAAVDPNSANIINSIGATTTLHPDFGFRHLSEPKHWNSI